MMRRLGLFVLCVLAISVGSALERAVAAPDGRLAGDYRITGKITKSSDGSRGEVRSRIWRFRPLCNHGPCRRVLLVRHGPRGSAFRSFLKRKRAGVWRGVERKRIPCAGRGRAKQKATIRLRITRKARDGRALAFRGRVKFVHPCPDGRFVEKARVFGRAR